MIKIIRFNSKKSTEIIFRNYFVNDFSYPSFVMNGESINPIGPRKHAFLFPGFLENFERFYLFVSKNS